ncbi:hypothetical protein S83_070357 [Arachis hypogaea]
MPYSLAARKCLHVLNSDTCSQTLLPSPLFSYTSFTLFRCHLFLPFSSHNCVCQNTHTEPSSLHHHHLLLLLQIQSSVMEKNLSPVMQQELANLDKDPDSRKSAMKALKSYVKDLDCKAIPVFLAKVSQTKETGSLSGEFTISLYEVLARVHQVKIVPMIDSIMVSIVQTLASSAGSFPLHQACSKVVLAIARYGIEPTAPEDKKRQIIHSICKPLCDSLSSSQDSLTSGAALCLKALVDSDNWRFASSEMVNRVCQNVAVGLWHWRESPLKPMLTWVWLCRW